MILFILFGLLPSFIWLSFFLQEDIHPEPRKMVFLVFLGGVSAAVIAVAIQYYFQVFLDNNTINQNGFFAVSGFAALEEIFKFAATYLIVKKSKYFDEPIDAMIYMVTAAAGMAAVENVSIMIGSEAMPEKAGILVFRFLGATLLHVLSSALVGYYWAKGLIKKKGFFLFILTGLIFATLLHAIFNYFIIIFNGGAFYSILFLVFVAFFIFYDFEKLKKSNKI